MKSGNENKQRSFWPNLYYWVEGLATSEKVPAELNLDSSAPRFAFALRERNNFDSHGFIVPVNIVGVASQGR